MFTKIMRMKTHQPGSSLAKSVTVRTVKVLTFVALAVVLTILPTRVSAATVPACHVDIQTFCASIDQKQPAWFAAQMETSATALVHTGPGLDYFAYWQLPAGFASQIIGISQDGKWYAIPLPEAIAQDGTGWIPAAAVNAKNIQAMPVWLEHCDQMTYCGYILAHSPQYVPVMQASSAAPRFGMATPY